MGTPESHSLLSFGWWFGTWLLCFHILGITSHLLLGSEGPTVPSLTVPNGVDQIHNPFRETLPKDGYIRDYLTSKRLNLTSHFLKPI